MATTTMEVSFARGVMRLLDQAGSATVRVAGMADVVYARVFTAKRHVFKVTQTPTGTMVVLEPFAELILRDVIAICRSQVADDVKLERAKQSLTLAGF